MDKRYAALFALIALVAASPLFSGFSDLKWESAQILGLIGALLCLLLMGASLRPRQTNPATLISLKRHTALGWAALIAALLHGIGCLIADHTMIEYFKPSMPLHLWMGFAATLLLLYLVLGSGTRVRRLWRSHRAFQATHVLAGGALLVLSALHIVGSDRYASGWWRRLIWLAAMIVAMALLLVARRRAAHAAPKPRLVFGRHGVLITCGVLLFTLTLGLLYAGAAHPRLRTESASLAHELPLDFPHSKHVQVNCLVCHHNWADATGQDRCIGCHQSNRADLKVAVEARFHMFCLDCHRHPAADLKNHGPVAGCESCHHHTP